MMRQTGAAGRTAMFATMIGGWVVLAAALGSAAPASAYEVWLTDQSDTGKESGGYLHIYDGAQLAANPASAKPTMTIEPISKAPLKRN